MIGREVFKIYHPAETVTNAIDHIRVTHPDLAAGLSTLAHEFHYDQILQLLEPDVPKTE